MKEEPMIVQQIRTAQTDTAAADALIRQYLPFIKAETAKFTKRIPIEGRDDELGIAMFAFYESMMAYQVGKGSFLKLAALNIRNRLIDFYRKEQRHKGVISLETPINVDGDDRTLLDQIDSGSDEITLHSDRTAARDEIQHFSSQLSEFGLNLTDVADCCPKQERTLAACMEVLEFAKHTPELLEQMVHTKKLPLAQLAAGTKVERKTLERHRKYLIAILLAYTNGFEIIRGHLKQIHRKEGQRA